MLTAEDENGTLWCIFNGCLWYKITDIWIKTGERESGLPDSDAPPSADPFGSAITEALSRPEPEVKTGYVPDRFTGDDAFNAAMEAGRG